MQLQGVVDLNDRRTWPKAFRTVVEDVAPWYGGDRFLNAGEERRAIAALEGKLVRAYHCTRLTDRERRSVETDGLQLLSTALAQRRLEDAVADKHLTKEEGILYSRTPLPNHPDRRGMVSFFTDRLSLADASEIGYLVGGWGGEGINMDWDSHSPEFKRLERVGKPSVVIAGIDPQLHCERASPGILDAAVRYFLEGTGATTIQSVIAVAPRYIERIEQAGSPYWQRYVWTPREGFAFD